ncbi:hypothetical protein POVWA1_001130 [Plasmodium ovale wallikeri]|uniref:Uncharacterized protein n=1 Tax=Plasmodium ovale wallikeri TaxID=864142 RepID=A0A1A8YFX7_PLAOA|nr:hypothetical protein POVWA1_001130 [Plasmodium ovale wallikeri]
MLKSALQNCRNIQILRFEKIMNWSDDSKKTLVHLRGKSGMNALLGDYGVPDHRRGKNEGKKCRQTRLKTSKKIKKREK